MKKSPLPEREKGISHKYMHDAYEIQKRLFLLEDHDIIV